MHNKPIGKKEYRGLNSIPMLIICIAMVAVIYGAFFLELFPRNIIRYLIQIFLFIAIGEMWNLMSGFAGITSLGQQLYIGLAGYSVAVAATTFQMPLIVGLLIGVVVCAVISLLVELLLSQISGMYFTIATLVVAEAFQVFFLSWDFVNKGSGMTIQLAHFPTIGEIGVLAFTACVISLVLVYVLLRSRIGVGLTVMRDDMKAAAAIGVNVFSYRLLIYILAAVITGLAGGIFFVNNGVIYPDSGFSISWTVSLVFIVIIGGSGTVGGPIIGSIVYVFLEELLAHFPGWSNIILGVITILVILFLPKGIVGTLQDKFKFEIFSARRYSTLNHK